MRKVKFALPLVLLLALAIGCATTPWKRQAVTGFETIGVSLQVVQKNAKLFYDSGTITKDQYDKIGAIYKPAKQLAIQTKEALDVAIDTAGTIEEGGNIDKYLALLAQYKTLFYNLLDLALEFGIISKPEYGIYKTM